MPDYTTITAKGQVTVPKEIRERFTWAEGTKLRFYVDGNEIKVKEVTLIDEMEDLIIKDLKEAGYKGEELKAKVVERKEMLDSAFEQLLQERLGEKTIPLDEAIRSIE